MVEEVLRVRVRPEFIGAVGFGDVYECRVVEVQEGGLEDASLKVTVLPADRELAALLTGRRELELGFAKHKENEPYALTPISGFVDRNRISWRITDAREAT